MAKYYFTIPEGVGFKSYYVRTPSGRQVVRFRVHTPDKNLATIALLIVEGSEISIRRGISGVFVHQERSYPTMDMDFREQIQRKLKGEGPQWVNGT